MRAPWSDLKVDRQLPRSSESRQRLVGRELEGPTGKVVIMSVDKPNNNTRWWIRCLNKKCGAFEVRWSTSVMRQVEANRPLCLVCRPSRSLPRLCRSCGSDQREKFAVCSASLCRACARSGTRNGFCECGRAIRYQRIGPSPKACCERRRAEKKKRIGE